MAKKKSSKKKSWYNMQAKFYNHAKKTAEREVNKWVPECACGVAVVVVKEVIEGRQAGMRRGG